MPGPLKVVRSCDSVAVQRYLGDKQVPAASRMSGLETGARSGFLWGEAVGIGGRQAGRRGRKWSRVGRDRRRARRDPGPKWVKVFASLGKADVDESRCNPVLFCLLCGDSY